MNFVKDLAGTDLLYEETKEDIYRFLKSILAVSEIRGVFMLFMFFAGVASIITGIVFLVLKNFAVGLILIFAGLILFGIGLILSKLNDKKDSGFREPIIPHDPPFSKPRPRPCPSPIWTLDS